MPVRNEAPHFESVLREWLDALAIAKPFTLFVIDDGSTDDTPQILNEFAKKHESLRVETRTSSGHSQSLLFGYYTATAEGADWILQIDSDGQCDPKFFQQFWEARKDSQAIFGYRTVREDGYSRLLIGRLLRLILLVVTGEWLLDANVPYRLIHREALLKALPHVANDAPLSNISLAAALNMAVKMKWIEINFRQRSGGHSHFNARRMLSLLLSAAPQLWRMRTSKRKTK